MELERAHKPQQHNPPNLAESKRTTKEVRSKARTLKRKFDLLRKQAKPYRWEKETCRGREGKRDNRDEKEKRKKTEKKEEA